MLTKLYCRALSAKAGLKRRLSSEKGAVDLVVIILLIAIVIGLAFVFRDKLSKLVTDIFDKADPAVNEFMQTPKPNP